MNFLKAVVDGCCWVLKQNGSPIRSSWFGGVGRRCGTRAAAEHRVGLVAAEPGAGSACAKWRGVYVCGEAAGPVDAGRARLALTPPQQTPSGPVAVPSVKVKRSGMAKALTDWRQRHQLTLDATTLLPRRIEQADTGAHPGKRRLW